MIAITLGFESSKKDSLPINLYTGNDAAAAQEIFLNPPAHIQRTELYKNPQALRRRVHELGAVLPEIEPQPEPEEQETDSANAEESIESEKPSKKK